MLDNCREISVMNHTKKDCVEQTASSPFLSGGSTAGAAVVPLHLEQEPAAQHTGLQRWYRGVPLASGSGSTAGGTAGGTARLEKDPEHPTVPERYQCGTTAGFICSSTKGPSGTTASTAVVPPDLAATVPHVVPLQLGSGVHQVPWDALQR